ncbi:hypothetical protein EJ08DRAFT_664872 [Tothia fuscella]|uniref:Uncharacterized protein n=1 Tax=Tothia fuscella TaxID=1048955 RepID=A0A9P4TU15_9PEZI|nr:hypothetical protein EJ08DRAFT_664872 [Tothia fuscella]
MKATALLPFATLATAAVIALVPDVQTFPSPSRKDAVITRVRYGPHTLKQAVGTPSDPKGTKTTIVTTNAQKPCSDCTLLSMNGGVQYANGSEASNPSVYLHHGAIINVGPDARDGTCDRPAYDLFFSTGNERSTIIYTNADAAKPAGYYIQISDKFVLQSEIINSDLEEKQVWVYMNYEHIPGKPVGHQQTKVAWLSADTPACQRKTDLETITASGDAKLGAGEYYPPNEKSFTLTGKPWTSPWNGNFVALGGHMHDGGVNIEIYQNNKLLCDSQAKYADGAGHDMSGSGGHGNSAVSKHLASMSGCRNTNTVKKGDQFHIVVNYDFEKHPG